MGVTEDGSFGPTLPVRDDPMTLFDMVATVEGDIVIAANVDALLLSSGETTFSSLGVPGRTMAAAVLHLEW